AQSQSLVESGVRARGRGAERDLGMPLIGAALHVLIEADQPRQLLGTVRRELDHASAAWFSRALFSRALFSRALLSRARPRVVPSAARHAVTSCGVPAVLQRSQRRIAFEPHPDVLDEGAVDRQVRLDVVLVSFIL